jgi:hypothetical protein
MKSQMLGKSTSEAEVTNIDSHGIWLFVEDKEYFLPYDNHPWFRNAKVGEILHVQLLHGTHLHWPDLDVDLTVDSIENPDKYPLTYRY